MRGRVVKCAYNSRSFREHEETAMAASKETMGFIGLGVLGGRRARRLLEHAYPLLLHDVNPAAVKALVKRGAQVAKSPPDVANRARIVFASLPTPPVLREVALGNQGLISGKTI